MTDRLSLLRTFLRALHAPSTPRHLLDLMSNHLSLCVWVDGVRARVRPYPFIAPSSSGCPCGEDAERHFLLMDEWTSSNDEPLVLSPLPRLVVLDDSPYLHTCFCPTDRSSRAVDAWVKWVLGEDPNHE